MNLFFSLATYNFLAAGAETGNLACMKVDPFAFDAPITYMRTSTAVQKQMLHTRLKMLNILHSAVLRLSIWSCKHVFSYTSFSGCLQHLPNS